MTSAPHAAYPRLGEWVWHGLTVRSGAPADTLQQAFRWYCDFNHDEAGRLFRRVVAADASCAMACYGAALCSGPNYDKPWELISEADVAKAHAYAADAVTRATTGTRLEQALCAALVLRFPQPTLGSAAEMQLWNVRYADAMAEVARTEGACDVDALALAAEANMAVTPWDLWDLKTGEPRPAPARTLLVVELLEKAMRLVEEGGSGLPTHTGALHYYIHTMEMSPTPEKALRAADVLASGGTWTDAGHLLHMGSHIHIQCGEYHKAMVSNKEAALADLRYFETRGTRDMFRCRFLLHNYHFMAYGAMFAGDYAAAMWAANGICEAMTPEMMATWAVYGDAYRAVRYHVMVRFGKWCEILAEALPPATDDHLVETAFLRYARTLAYALRGGGGDAARAEEEARRFEDACARVPSGRTRVLHNNTAEDVLAVSGEMMRGEVAFRRGEHDAGLAHLRRAVEMEDALPYDEPWGVMQPTRHALGALLLEAGRAEEALAVYHEDLGLVGHAMRQTVHVDNLWAVLGVVDCCRQLERSVCGSLLARLSIALARADSNIKASCFCRLSVCGAPA